MDKSSEQPYRLRNYKCLLRFGHVGSGKSRESFVTIKARNAVEAMHLAAKLGGTKKGTHVFKPIISIEEVNNVRNYDSKA